MNVTYQFSKIGVFLTKNRLVPVLKELPMTVVSLVEGNCVTGKEACHDRREWNPASLTQKMDMIIKEHPCITGGTGIGEYLPHPFHKAVFICIYHGRLIAVLYRVQ